MDQYSADWWFERRKIGSFLFTLYFYLDRHA